MAERSPPPRREAPPEPEPGREAPPARVPADPRTWLDLVARYGFTFVFSLVALGYGVYFGQQLLEAQRTATASLTRLEVYGAQLSTQLADIERRLERIEVRVAAQGAAPAP